MQSEAKQSHSELACAPAGYQLPGGAPGSSMRTYAAPRRSDAASAFRLQRPSETDPLMRAIRRSWRAEGTTSPLMREQASLRCSGPRVPCFGIEHRQLPHTNPTGLSIHARGDPARRNSHRTPKMRTFSCAGVSYAPRSLLVSGLEQNRLISLAHLVTIRPKARPGKPSPPARTIRGALILRQCGGGYYGPARSPSPDSR